MALFTKQSLGSLTDSIGGAIDAYGVARQRQSLADLGELAMKGDYNALGAKAIEGGNIEFGLKALAEGRKQANQAGANEAAVRVFGGGEAQPVQPAPASGSGFSVGGFGNAVRRTLGFEGGRTNDTGGDTNFGISANANPDVNIGGIDKSQAVGLYKQRYWDQINGDELNKINPKLAHVAFDTAVIAGPGKAAQFIGESGGDPNKLLDARQTFQEGLIRDNPEKYGQFAKGWQNRIDALRADIGGGAPLNQVASNDQGFVPRETSGQQAGLPAPSNGASYSSADIQALIRDENYRPLVIDYLKQKQNQKSTLPTSVQEFEYGRTNPEFARAQEARRAKETSYGVIGQDEFGQPQYGYPPTREEFAARLAANVPSTPQGKIARDNAQREAEATRLGLQGDERLQYVTSGKVPMQGEKVTEGQSRARMLELSARNANDLLDNPEFISGGLGATGVFGAATADIPGVGLFIAPEAYQRFRQAGEDFTQNILFLKSGAAAPASEVQRLLRTFMPPPNASKAQIAQAKQSRKVALDGAMEAARRRDGGAAAKGGGGSPLDEARSAISKGANRDAVISRLRERGIDPGGL